jgi:WhiB family transcriptional regulator, redox-sensing transcriptional regulator
MDWLDRARCLDQDPELFFPIGTTGLALDQIEDAKAVCLRCEVRTQCLAWALETAQDAGVWGGTSEEERRIIRRARRREERAAREAREREEPALAGTREAASEQGSRDRLAIAG